MDLGRMFERLGRMLFRRTLTRGLTTGIEKAASGGKPKSEMTPAERKQAQAGKQAARRARQAMRVGRRIGRF